MHPFSKLPSFESESGDLHVVIDTPKGAATNSHGTRNLSFSNLQEFCPAGPVFPYDFGFIPNTRGEDGDAIDVLVLMDEPAFSGCLVVSRLLGVIEAEQTETDGRVERNDRLIAVSAKSHTHGHLKSLDQISGELVDEIEHFFVSYNAARGKKFKPLGRSGPERAKQLVLESATASQR
jgi:inorganic pyrophosphatase